MQPRPCIAITDILLPLVAGLLALFFAFPLDRLLKRWADRFDAWVDRL